MNITLNDDEILDGLRKHDETVTQRYFYDYCRMAYYMCNGKYDLAGKPGMDFYSLAHEYYIALDSRQWRQMEDRRPGVTLRTWMTGGFRFLVLDKLKQSEYERMTTDIAHSAGSRNLTFDMPDNSAFNEDIRKTIMEIADMYYGRDHVSSIILKMLLVDGYKGKEVAEQFGISPAAVTQRYRKMMKEVVIPYFKRYYEPVAPTAAIAEFYDMEEEKIYYSKPAPEATRGRLHKLPGRLFRHNKTTKDMDNGNIEIQQDIDISSRITPERISRLEPGEIFVFGSNLHGMHGGGAARIAFLHFGAVMGQGVGLQGQSYGIPTMQGGTETIAPYVDEFIDFAQQHPEMRFLVTRIGCGIAGFSPEEIAPLFAAAVPVTNISLPLDFWNELL